MLFLNLLLLWSGATRISAARALRPLLFLERLRNIRRIVTNIVQVASLARVLFCVELAACTSCPPSRLQALPKILNVAILLGAHTLLFGVLGFALFSGVQGRGQCSVTRSSELHCSTYTDSCRDYFSTLQDSFMHCTRKQKCDAVPALPTTHPLPPLSMRSVCSCVFLFAAVISVCMVAQ